MTDIEFLKIKAITHNVQNRYISTYESLFLYAEFLEITKLQKNMCPPAKNNTHKHKHFFFEVASDQESFIKNSNMHTPEQQLIHEEHEQHEQHEHAPQPLRRNRRAIGHQLSSELLLRYQLFVERRHHQETQEAFDQEREHHQVTQATLAQEREHHQEELAQERERSQQIAQQVELYREIRQIERQLRSSDTPVNIREQLRCRHEELCALLDISDKN